MLCEIYVSMKMLEVQVYHQKLKGILFLDVYLHFNHFNCILIMKRIIKEYLHTVISISKYIYAKKKIGSLANFVKNCRGKVFFFI